MLCALDYISPLILRDRSLDNEQPETPWTRFKSRCRQRLLDSERTGDDFELFFSFSVILPIFGWESNPAAVSNDVSRCRLSLSESVVVGKGTKRRHFSQQLPRATSLYVATADSVREIFAAFSALQEGRQDH